MVSLMQEDDTFSSSMAMIHDSCDNKLPRLQEIGFSAGNCRFSGLLLSSAQPYRQRFACCRRCRVPDTRDGGEPLTL
jgi:hypothetical protein